MNKVNSLLTDYRRITRFCVPREGASQRGIRIFAYSPLHLHLLAASRNRKCLKSSHYATAFLQARKYVGGKVLMTLTIGKKLVFLV